MTANTILMTYQFTGGLYTCYRSMIHVTKNVIITVTIGMLLMLLMGISNVTCVLLTLTPKEATTV